ncbi:g-like domain repeat protein [Anaeramoeba ignava]|uniref:G-like domain repeat protein n=1 Tax=Anaeramoeba ignava TaxID=1746090 RepID=A0A9Q0RBG7_ANAIG|nr:g-like domain repeat protein [Anaeramoeba ignava]
MNFVLLFFISFTCFFFLVQSQVTLLNSFDFPFVMDNSQLGFLDEDEGFLYFLDRRDGGMLSYLWKYDMYTFEFLDYLNIGIGSGMKVCGAIDTVNKLLYVATYYVNNIFVKIDLNTMQVVDNITFSDLSANEPKKVEIDLVNQKAYVGYQNPIYVVKVDLASFTEESNLTLSNYMLIGSVIDVDNGILYVSTDSNSGNNATIYKIDLSTFTEVDSLLVSLSGVAYLRCGVIDSTNQMMYFGTNQNPMKIVKTNLTDFTSVGSVTVSGDQYCAAAGIDILNKIGYFISENGYLVYLNLTTFTITNSFYFNGTHTYTMVIDSYAENAYIPTEDSQIFQISLPELTEGKKRDFLDYSNPELILIDETNQIGYVYFDNYGGIIAKVDLQSFSLVDHLNLGLSDDIYQGEIDLTNGFIYLFPDTENLTITKIRLSNFSVDETVQLYSGGSVDATSFDQQNQILYVGLYNSSDSKDYLIKISCPDLQIIDSLEFPSLVTITNLYLDSAHEYLYIWVYDDSAVGSCYFLDKIQLSNLTQVGSVNLTQYDFTDPLLDQTHQLFFYGDQNTFSIFRVDLISMEVINDSLNISEWNSFQSSFIESSDTWVYFVVAYEDPYTDEYEKGGILQIEASSNELISNTTFNILSTSFMQIYDTTTNYGYLLDCSSTPIMLYQLSFPSVTPPPSSSQQILFSFLIFGIMILILGLF